MKIQCPARKQLKRLRDALDQAMTTGEVEAIHDIRVATRRLSELLELMGNWVDQGELRWAAREVRRIRKAFQEVRELDVLLSSLCQPPAAQHLQADELAHLEGMLTLQREKTLEQGRGKCQASRCKRAISRVGKLCKSFEKAAGGDLDGLRLRLERMYRERTLDLLSHDPRHTDSSDLHGDRIRLKRLRYCAEMVRWFELGLNEELMQEFALVQELLGSWHDHLVAADRVAGLALKHSPLFGQTTWSAGLLRYAAVRLCSAEEDRRRILESWPRLEEAVQGARLGYAEVEPPKENAGLAEETKPEGAH
jgi:CHAD domain-containing protein